MMLRLLEQKEFSSSHSDSKASQLDMSADYNSCYVFVLQLLRLERCILLTLVTDSICAIQLARTIDIILNMLFRFTKCLEQS